MDAKLRQLTPLSPAATRVLAALRASAHSPDLALTDAELAQAAGLPHRHVIDARGELLDHGILVITDGGGSWLLGEGDPLDWAYQLRRSLRRRIVAIARRERAVSRAIRERESRQRPPAPPGAQLGLYASGSTALRAVTPSMPSTSSMSSTSVVSASSRSSKEHQP